MSRISSKNLSRISFENQEFIDYQEALLEEDYRYMGDEEPEKFTQGLPEKEEKTQCAFGICVDVQRMYDLNGNDTLLQLCAPCLRVQDLNVCNTPVDWLTGRSASMTCETFLAAVHAKIDMKDK